MRSRSWMLLALALGVVLGGTVVAPMLELFGLAMSDGGLSRFGTALRDPLHQEAIWNSLWLSGATVLGCALFGVPIALLTHRLGRVGGVIRGMALLPLFLPPVLGTLAFWFLFERRGVLGRLFPGFEVDFQGNGAILVVHVLTMSVYFLLFVTASLERTDADLARAARTLGASPGRTLLTVTLPLQRPALANAAVLTFMSAMASFTAPYVFGTSERFLTTDIVLVRHEDPKLAAALSLILALISLAALTFLLGVRSVASPSGRTQGRAEPPSRRIFLWSAAASLVPALLASLPLVTVLIMSLKPNGRLGSQGLFEGLTLENYRIAVSGLLGGHVDGQSAQLAASIGRSASYAAIATAANVVIGILLVFGCARSPRLLRKSFEFIAMMPIAVPGTVIGLSLAAAFSESGIYGIGPSLLGTSAILVIAYFVRDLPLLLRALNSGAAQIAPAMIEASRSLGARPLRAFTSVTLPLVMPSLLSGSLLAFVTAIGEFVASILLWVPRTRPASVAIYDDFRSGLFGTAAAAGVLLALVTGIAFLILRFLQSRRTQRRSPKSV